MLLAAALALLCAAVATWFVAQASRPAARVQLRFAAVLIAALAVAPPLMPAAASAVALLVLPVVFVVLVLATAAGAGRAAHQTLAAVLLALVSLAALAAAITGLSALALAPCALAVLALIGLSLRRLKGLGALQGIAAALCLLGAICVFVLEGVSVPLLLFCAAGLLGTTLALSRSDVRDEERARPDLRRLGVGVGRRV
jgi:hypothetical protein